MFAYFADRTGDPGIVHGKLAQLANALDGQDGRADEMLAFRSGCERPWCTNTVVIRCASICFIVDSSRGLSSTIA